MMIQSQLKRMVDRAVSFSDKHEQAQRCVLERKGNLLYVTGSDGLSGILIWEEDEGDNFETAVHAYALQSLLDCFRLNDKLTLEFVNNTLVVSKDIKNSYALPTYSPEGAYRVPPPGVWTDVGTEFSRVIRKVAGWPIRNIRTANNLPLALYFDEDRACIISGHISWFSELETNLNLNAVLSGISRSPDVITGYSTSNGFLYFRGVNEWCMFPTDSRNPVKYQILFDNMEKKNDIIVHVMVDDLIELVQRVKTMHKTEGILTPSESAPVRLAFTNASVTAFSSLGQVSMTAQSDVDFTVIERKTNIDFMNIISHSMFLDGKDKVEFLIGKEMDFIACRAGSESVMGGLFR